MYSTIQQSAIDFYSENFQYVADFGLSNLDFEDRNLFRQGKKLIEDALQTATKKERIPHIESEILPVLEEYLNTYYVNGRVKVFDRKIASKGMQSFRNDPVASAMALHGQMVFFDNYNKDIVKCLNRAGKTLKSILKSYNESVGFDRFNV